MPSKTKPKKTSKNELETLRQKVFQLEKDDMRHRNVEEAFKRMEEEHASILDGITELIVLQDTGNRVLWANHAAGESVGLAPEHLTGRFCYQIWHKRDKPCNNCPIIKSAQTGIPQNGEIESPDGRVWLIKGYPVMDNKGKIKNIVEVTTEITERHKAEQELNYRVEFKKLITTLSADFIDFTGNDIDTGINKALEAIGKFANADRSYIFLFHDNAGLMDNIHEWCAEGISAQIDRLKNIPTKVFPWFIEKMRKLETIYVPNAANMPREAAAEQKEFLAEGIKSLINVPMVYRNRLMGFLGFDFVRGERSYSDDIIALLNIAAKIFTNTLQRKEAEDSLRESETRFRLVTENSIAGVCIIKNDTFLYTNPALPKIFGYNQEEFTGKGLRLKNIVYQEDWPAINNYINGGRGKNDFISCVFRGLRKDNILIYCEMLGKAIEYCGQDAIIGIILDVTEQKIRENLKDEFITTVSHELRTPLSIIKQGISLITSNSLGPINKKQSEVLTIADDNVSRLVRIINNLLDISRVEAGRVELKKELVDASGLAKTAMAAFKQKAENKKIELKISAPAGIITAHMDADKIVQVLNNLVENAIKFTEKGFVELAIKENGTDMVYHVRDSGVGMSKNEAGRIFDKFTQLSGARQSKETGSGLGLFITKGIVDMHNGKIWVESEPGKGSCFSFSVPRYASEEAFNECVRRKIEQAKKNNSTISLMRISIGGLNSLKNKPDNNGFFLIFKGVDTLLKSSLRQSEDAIIYTFTEEEIFVLFTDCAPLDAEKIKERLKNAIETYFHKNAPGAGIKPVISYAVYPDQARNENELARIARKGD